jgi:aminoglycoside phosphotransferase
VSTGHALALRPDPAVPQRDILMDSDIIAGRLSSQLGVNGALAIESCRRDSVSYRVGRRLRVGYRVRIAGKDHHVAASTFRNRSRSERAYRNATASAPSAGPLRGAVHDADLNTVFWTFPNDRRIGNLSAIASAAPELTRYLDFRWTTSHLVDYYPEASAVVRCLDESNQVIAYAKVHAGDEGERTHRVQHALVRAARGSSLRLARPLAYSKQHRTLVVEPIVGRAIGSLDGLVLVDGLHAYGAALASLHSLQIVELPAGPRSPLDRLHRKADGFGSVRPDVEKQSGELLDQLSARWADAAGPPVLVHGDTNVNNALLVDERVAFIDFDRASIGSAGSDIGNFIGLLRYLRSLGVLSPAAQSRHETSFMHGYSSVRALPDRSALRVHIAAALVERAFRAVTRLRPRALQRVPALLAEATAVLSANGVRR